MPRLAILADIHGNLPAFEAVLADLEQFKPIDRLIVAGDILAGPGQAVVYQRLAELGALMIQGNGEHSLLRMLNGSAPDYFYRAKQFALLRWALEQLSPQAIECLRALPAQAVLDLPGAQPIRVVHGSPRSPSELVYPDQPGQLEEVLALVAEPVIVFGHTHLPWQARQAGKLAFNPGAVCFPENGYVGAQYALLDWDGCAWQVTHRAVPYDMQALCRDYETSGFLACSPLVRLFLQEMLTGEGQVTSYFGHLRKLAEQAGVVDLDYYTDEVWDLGAATYPGWKEGAAPHTPCVPDEIWAQAEQTFPWDDPLPPLTAET